MGRGGRVTLSSVSFSDGIRPELQEWAVSMRMSILETIGIEEI